MSKVQSLKSNVSDLPDDVVLSVRGVSKKFCRNLKRSMWYGIQDLGRNLVGVGGKQYAPNMIGEDDTPIPFVVHPNGLRPSEFWALQDISFDLRRGETLGLIGGNGSGKTSLLRLLAGIFPPDRGELAIRGRVGALIALGAGFHPHLTGRENIYLNGAILGMTRDEIESRLDWIMEFAELVEFVDAPVATYSSGMRVRLGFAVATATTPDLLLIDEVLAVGDIGFRAKCFNLLNKKLTQTAVILVSHSMPQVARIADRVILLTKGRVAIDSSNVAVAIERYYDSFGAERSSIAGNGKAKLRQISLYSDSSFKRNGVPIVKYLEDLHVDVILDLEKTIRMCFVALTFTDKSLRIVAQCLSRAANVSFKNNGHALCVRATIPRFPLAVGSYSLTVNFAEHSEDEGWGESLGRYGNVLNFAVSGSAAIACSHAPIVLPCEWNDE